MTFYLQVPWELPLGGDKRAVQTPGRETWLPVAAACRALALADWSGIVKGGGDSQLHLQ